MAVRLGVSADLLQYCSSVVKLVEGVPKLYCSRRADDWHMSLDLLGNSYGTVVVIQAAAHKFHDQGMLFDLWCYFCKHLAHTDHHWLGTGGSMSMVGCSASAVKEELVLRLVVGKLDSPVVVHMLIAEVAVLPRARIDSNFGSNMLEIAVLVVLADCMFEHMYCIPKPLCAALA